VIGLRLRQMRELYGWTQTDLGAIAGLSQGQVSDIESGADPPRATIDRIAEKTGFSPEWFFQVTPEEFAEGTIRYRKSSKATKKDDKRAVRRLELAAELVAGLSSGFKVVPLTLPYLGDAKSTDEIESLAQLTRAALDLPASGPIRNLIRAIERAGVVVIGLPVDFGATGRIRHHHGVSAWPDLDARPVVGFSTYDPGDRQRHTVAHEVGHLVMHRGLPDPARDYEREASHFAGALMVPLPDAREALAGAVTLRRLADLKAMWGVSIASLVMRARQVDVIDEHRQESLYKQISARGWRVDEPVTVHREQPALLPRLLEANFGTPVDWVRTARSLGLPPHLLRELACLAERDRVDPDAGSVLEVSRLRRRAEA
jgi:Zn-dependent peptidase ImmA (M78 family)/transcriptional regulator with XRE-family HTH domain